MAADEIPDFTRRQTIGPMSRLLLELSRECGGTLGLQGEPSRLAECRATQRPLLMVYHAAILSSPAPAHMPHADAGYDRGGRIQEPVAH